ncbi:ALBINO3-like protein 1, chloroplastic [Sesamum angolense]|uniref:ALBINO3-like protein 1, chloroplastic n=1 Tax=Sesamum angolense TaxID=2727404 RepID=A0AAE1T5N1_9LAMI|nr:ALBINO3-like protein 1, chloroplastic [Sesamum angolense]
MSTFLYSVGPNSVLSPFPGRRTTLSPVSDRTHFSNFTIQRPFLRGSLGVARFGLGQVPFPDPEDAELMMKDLFGRVEGFLYTVADAAVASSDKVDAVATTKQNSDWLSGITNGMEVVLKESNLIDLGVESAMAMQSLAPQIKAIQERYAGDQERIQLETARLYKLAGINPLAGCLPTLATIPIWIGLYRALSNVADEGLLTEGFFWIPSLSGPTTIAARQTGSGTSWLFPFIDGHPPLGWSDTLAYLVLPVLLIITQYISVQIMQPPQSNDPNVKSSQAITKVLPLMIGYFALSVPSGLSLYWFTNNILSTVQQVWLRKLGGAKNPIQQFSDDSIKKEQSQVLKSISEEQSQVLKSISEAPAAKVVKKEEKLTSEGPRPGERFKQLKEQEARRKTREEERRKAEEAATKGIQITNGEVKKDISPLETEDSQLATSGSSSSIDGLPVNGNSVSSEGKDDYKASINNEVNSETPDDYKNRRDNLHLEKNMRRIEFLAAINRR